MMKLFKKPETGEAWLLAGLGNPGAQYEGNRHNIGFMAVDAVAGAHGFPAFRSKFQGALAEGRIAGHKIILLKPLTFMNNSGLSVVQASKFYKIAPSRIVVFHDELDLPGGKIRVKTGGGHAGHNGLRSIDSHLGTQDYIRIRMGIGHPGDREKVHGHVLSDFGKSERQWVDTVVQSVGRHAGFLVDGKESEFMSRVAMDAAPVTGAKE